MTEWLWVFGGAAALVFVVYSNVCAYRNGVTDGFGFAWEPKNPGYQKAGRYLRKYMSYRWRQLKNPDYQPESESAL